jgi:hypothetical protein
LVKLGVAHNHSMKNQAVDYLIGVVSPLRRKLSHSKMPEDLDLSRLLSTVL